MIKQPIFKNIKNQKMVTIFLLIVVGIVAVIAVARYYSVNANNSSKNKQATTSSQQPSVVSKVVISPTTSAQNNVLTIKEYGVAVPLASDLQGLSYTTQSNPQKTLMIVDLKLARYTNMANECLGLLAHTSQYIGSIVKTNGQYDPARNPNVRNLKQFDSFYVADIGASQPAKVTCKDSSLQPQYDSLYAQLNSDLDSSFANAKLSS